MSEYDDHGRPEPPHDGDELSTLVGFLEFQRATLAWKCSGVDGAGLQATTAASSMTLGGLMNHMAWVEDYWFSRRLFDRGPASPWDAVDWTAEPDWEWTSAASDTPEALLQRWTDACARSRDALADALADGGLDRSADRPWANGLSPNVRWILVHMVEEYARHNGHADLLREAVDGAIGE